MLAKRSEGGVEKVELSLSLLLTALTTHFALCSNCYVFYPDATVWTSVVKKEASLKGSFVRF